MPPLFNIKADSYSQFAVVQRQLAEWLAEWLEPAERVHGLAALEFGAGEGLFTRLLAAKFARITAVEIAPRMVELGHQALPYVDWRVADAWCFENEPVDRLFSASLLQWSDDPASVLRHWRTLAKRNGRMVHGFYVTPTLVDWESIASVRSPIVWRTPLQWQELFREAGWTVLRSEARTHVLTFASALELVRFFHRTGSVTPRKTPVATLRRTISAYDRNFTSRDGGRAVTSTWTFFRIEAMNR
jgi:SAM-dependent methyltransferase